MWKCSNCGTDNEYNFCTNCQSSKEESGLKTPTPEQGRWKCSRCGVEIDGNFCGQCRMSRAENDTWQTIAGEETLQHPTAEQVAYQQPPPAQATDQQLFPEQMVNQQPPEQAAYRQPSPEQATYQQPSPGQTTYHQPPFQQPPRHQPEVDEKSSKKGVFIALVAIVAIVALLVAVVVFAMRLILSDDRDDTRDPDTYYVEEDIEVDEALIEEDQAVVIDSDGPYNLGVWGESNVMQLENDSMVLEVPLPPEIAMEEVELTGSTLSFGQGVGAQWFHVWIELGNRQLEDDFEEYSAYEVGRALRSHGNFGEVLDYHVYEERNVTLLTSHWEDEHGEGISFVKISEVHGYLLVTEIGFESLENRDDFFEAYGFNYYFWSIIHDVVAEWEANRADSTNQDQDEDRNGEVLWTDEQRDSWSDLNEEFWEVSDLAFDLFFLIWSDVINGDTIHEQYPNADVERLISLHTEFDDRFDELNVFPDVDITLPYDGEYNQNIFQETREMIQEFQRIYDDFRAALEGR